MRLTLQLDHPILSADGHVDFPLLPENLWRENAPASLRAIGLRNLDAIGEETVMWGSDFPHPDGTWPDSRELLEEQLADVPAAVRRKILFENAARLYGFPVQPG